MALAPQVANPAPGRDARYSLAGLTKLPDGTYTDGVYKYDNSGRGINRPNSTVSGLPPANSSESYNVYTGQVSAGGPLDGGGGGGGGDALSAYAAQLKSLLAAQSTADKSNTRAAIQQALIRFGLVPQGFKDELGAVDDTTRALIQKNTDTGISGYARLLEGKTDAEKALIANLSASGLRRSGAKGYKQRRGQLAYDRQYQDAISALLGDVGNKYQGFAANEQNRQMQLLQALAAAQGYGGYGGNNGYQPYTPEPLPVFKAPSYSAPAYQNSQYQTGQVQPSGYSVNTGGGWYTNQQTGGLTAKWNRLAGGS